MENFDAIIVGAGQAGLAVSHELNAAGIEHVVLERGRIGTTWRPLGLTSAPIGLRSLTPSPPACRRWTFMPTGMSGPSRPGACSEWAKMRASLLVTSTLPLPGAGPVLRGKQG